MRIDVDESCNGIGNDISCVARYDIKRRGNGVVIVNAFCVEHSI